MKIFLFLLLSSMAIQIRAEEDATSLALPVENKPVLRNTNYQINKKYKAGAYLIYDCKSEYYTCVDDEGFKECRKDRDVSINKKLKHYPCAPLKAFLSVEACLVKNYEVIESLAFKRFCFPKN